MIKALGGALLGAAFLLFTPSAKSDPFYSQAFHLYSTCNGADQVYRWQIEGWPQMGWNIKAWQGPDIYVFGISVTVFSGDMTPVQSPWWMIGSTYSSGDTILFMGPGETSKLVWFPEGKTIHIPGTASPDWAIWKYLDMHGLCWGTGPVNVWITLYYTYDKHP